MDNEQKRFCRTCRSKYGHVDALNENEARLHKDINPSHEIMKLREDIQQAETTK